jgi:small redox-active disulfide protein 2
MEIKILGYDCPHCDKLQQRAIRAVEQLHIDASVEKVNDPEDVWSYGIIKPPTLVIDGHIVSQGRMMTIAELKRLLKQIHQSSS